MQNATYFMGTEVLPLDPDQAKRERFISLHQLMYWLEKSPHPRGAWPPDMALLGLAQRHIRAGRLKTYGLSNRAIVRFVSRPGECIEDGEVHQTEILDMRIESQEQADNPLLDIFEFTDWFWEINPDHLRLPDNWPAPEVDQANRPATQPIQAAPPEPTEEFLFNAKYVTHFSEPLRELAQELYGELGVNANLDQAWKKLETWKPNRYQVIKKRNTVEIAGKELAREEFNRMWKRWVR